MYDSLQQFPFILVKQSLASFTVILKPYTTTQEPECLNVVYSAEVVSVVDPPIFDPFSTPVGQHVNVTANTIEFTNFHDYTEGSLPIEVKIFYDWAVSVAYTINFQLTVIDEVNYFEN